MRGSPGKSTCREFLVSTHAHLDADTMKSAVFDPPRHLAKQGQAVLPHFSTKVRGTGLGLAIAARIVVTRRQHPRRRTIFHRSQFRLELPVARIDACSVPPQWTGAAWMAQTAPSDCGLKARG